ncbi:hypothetical protein [Geotalea sp. SG265]|uniref:hypothetical protein n=1 Tax=Geotalea sp. SG265 TaxID=2922867 RepID=UPI001FAF80A1|nr:hypothetical protein [Geotalea sp. SG265]
MNYGNYLLAGFLTLSMAACSATGARTQQPLAGYPYRHQAFDLNVAWKTVSSGQGTSVEGVVQNVRYVQVRDMEVTVLLLDGKKVLARGRSFTSPNRIDRDDMAGFDLYLNASPRPGDLLQFIIQYQALDDASNSFHWLGSFTVDALSGKSREKP